MRKVNPCPHCQSPGQDKTAGQKLIILPFYRECNYLSSPGLHTIRVLMETTYYDKSKKTTVKCL